MTAARRFSLALLATLFLSLSAFQSSDTANYTPLTLFKGVFKAKIPNNLKGEVKVFPDNPEVIQCYHYAPFRQWRENGSATMLLYYNNDKMPNTSEAMRQLMLKTSLALEQELPKAQVVKRTSKDIDGLPSFQIYLKDKVVDNGTTIHRYIYNLGIRMSDSRSISVLFFFYRREPYGVLEVPKAVRIFENTVEIEPSKVY